MKLLITSVGSLVGQGILDVLESPGRSRRSLVTVIGTNSVADAANNFRCDRCYLVPQTVATEFPARMREILATEGPDLILCGRDEDTFALSRLKAEAPALPGTLPIGKPEGALIGLDKWQTWLFARKHGVPFAETFMPGTSGDAAALESFCREYGYPLMAKPVRGFASIGVHFLQDAGDVRTVTERGGYLLQEYLGNGKALESYFASFKGPVPLFAHAPNTVQHSCMTVIGPSGDAGPVLCLENHLDYGMATRLTRVSDSSLEEVTRVYARALAADGVGGPMNLNVSRDRNGACKALEINLRNTGSTYPRFLMGFDELYLIARAYVPHVHFPACELADADRPHRLTRYFSAQAVDDAKVAALARTGRWSRSAP